MNERLRLSPIQPLVNYWDDKSASFEKLPFLVLTDIWCRWRGTKARSIPPHLEKPSSYRARVFPSLTNQARSSQGSSECLFYFGETFHRLKARCRWMVTCIELQLLHFKSFLHLNCFRVSATCRYADRAIGDASVCADEYIFLITNWRP